MLIIVLLIVIYYLIKKYNFLKNLYIKLFYEKKTLEIKVEELQDYKRDISKTFNILDNELNMINKHIKEPVTKVKTPINYVLNKNILKDLIDEDESEKEINNEKEETKINEEEETKINEEEKKINEEDGKVYIFNGDDEYADYKI